MSVFLCDWSPPSFYQNEEKELQMHTIKKAFLHLNIRMLLDETKSLCYLVLQVAEILWDSHNYNISVIGIPPPNQYLKIFHTSDAGGNKQLS